MADVRCDEVCVYCRKHYERASEYIRHARAHQDANASERKKAYTKQTCDELRKLVKKELMELLSRTGAKKRKWEEATGILGSCHFEMDKAGVTDSPHRPNESAPASMPVADVAVHFADISTQPQPPYEVPIPALDDDDPYDPPLFHTVNFVQYHHSMGVEGVGLHMNTT